MNRSDSQNLPITYDPAYEILEDDEAETQISLNETLLKITEKTVEHSGHAIRSVHAKNHGLLVGELRVVDNLPHYYAQGMFAKAATFPVIMRFSTPPGDLLDDNVSLPRGLAIKIIGVEGEQLMRAQNAVTQDFVLVNSPAFLAPNAKKFLANLKLLAATTDKVPGLKKALSSVLQVAEKLVEAVGGESGKIKSMGGHPETHLLGETFFSQAPILYGDYMAKVAIFPVSDALIQLKDQTVDLKDKPDGLREAVIEFFAHNSAQWALRVQLNTDINKMPIEDSSVEWPQELSAYFTVATITVKPQSAYSEARVQAVNEKMSFSPWHGITAHRPLGSIMRVRKMAYEVSAHFRAEKNGVTLTEPNNLDDLPA